MGLLTKEINEAMDVTDIITVVEEAYSLIQAAKADGTFTELQSAKAAVEAELAKPAVQTTVAALVAKLKTLKL
jgi:hypothetical protein